MRNQRFIAEHRGGPLTKEQHRQLIKATKSAGNSVEIERKWQEDQLPYQIKDLVISALQSQHEK